MSTEIDELSDIYKRFGDGPGNFRTVYDPNEYRDPYRMGTYYDMGTVMDYFKALPDITLKYQFFNTKNADIYRTIYKKIPLSLVTMTVTMLAEPVFCGFTETTDNIEWLDFENRFFYDLFFNEEIFVSYNFFEDDNNYEYDADASGEIIKKIEYYKKIGGFDTWVKCTGKEDDDDIRFMHLKSGIVFEIADWLEILAPAKWSSFRNQNFTKWFAYAVKWLTVELQIKNAGNLLVKRVHVHGTKDIKNQRDDIEERLESETSIFVHDIQQKMDVVPKVFLDGNDLHAMALTFNNQLDRLSYELGRVVNTNPKGDRYSTGENYKDITGIASRQKAVLKQLKAFAAKASKLWGIQLDFAINGIPQTEMIEEDQAEAGNPNTDKKPDAATAVSLTGK